MQTILILISSLCSIPLFEGENENLFCLKMKAVIAAVGFTLQWGFLSLGSEMGAAVAADSHAPLCIALTLRGGDL